MLYLLSGENSYAVQEKLNEIISTVGAEGEVIRLDGEDVSPADLADALAGISLFSSKKTVIIKNLSLNKSLWEALPDWLKRLDDDTNLILVESKLDKRTKTYKAVAKLASSFDFGLLTLRDEAKVRSWLEGLASAKGVRLTSQQIKLLINRALEMSDKPGQETINQWAIMHALEQLAVLDAVTDERIADVMPASATENVFELFDAALASNLPKVRQILDVLELNGQAPQPTLGLVISQMQNLMAVILSDKPTDEIAKDFGVHPYALSKLGRYRGQVSAKDLKYMINRLAWADETIKSSGADNWLILWQALSQLRRQP